MRKLTPKQRWFPRRLDISEIKRPRDTLPFKPRKKVEKRRRENAWREEENELSYYEFSDDVNRCSFGFMSLSKNQDEQTNDENSTIVPFHTPSLHSTQETLSQSLGSASLFLHTTPDSPDRIPETQEILSATPSIPPLHLSQNYDNPQRNQASPHKEERIQNNERIQNGARNQSEKNVIRQAIFAPSSPCLIPETQPLFNDHPTQNNTPFFESLPPEVQRVYASLNIHHPYDWQSDCLRSIRTHYPRNFFFTVPTSGGKTLIAEICLLRCSYIHKKKGLFILPFVSLVMEKAEQLSKLAHSIDTRVLEYHGSQGKMPPPPGNQIIIATYERFIVYCLLFIVYCLLFIVYCLLFIVYCLLFIVYCFI
jgi:hypothetical protein